MVKVFPVIDREVLNCTFPQTVDFSFDSEREVFCVPRTGPPTFLTTAMLMS
jgi:hypothetical protein